MASKNTKEKATRVRNVLYVGVCEHCRAKYDTKRADSRFCGTTCRVAAWKEAQAGQLALHERKLAKARKERAARKAGA